MDDQSRKIHRDQSRKAHNEEFVRRLHQRRPELKAQYERTVSEMAGGLETLGEFRVEGAMSREGTGLPPATGMEAVLETIVLKERPVLFVKDDWIDIVNVTTFGDEAKDLVTDLNARGNAMQPIIPSQGTMDVE